jgi:ribonuclease P protein component
MPSNLDYSQIGFVVSKKVSKSAVRRNSLRRRVSGIVEELYKDIKKPQKIIVLIRKDFTELKPEQLKNEVKNLFRGVVD